VIVMAIPQGRRSHALHPPADTAVEGGDTLIVMGRQENLRTLEDCWAESGKAAR